MSASDSRIDYTRALLQDAREELTRADSKAALLLAASGVVVGALLAGMLGGTWAPSHISDAIQWLWWLGVIAGAVGVGSIAAAVCPRIKRIGASRPALPAYYGDVSEYKSAAEFGQAIKGGFGVDLGDRLIDQTFQISRIVRQKYVLIRRGLLLFLFATLACSAAVFINIPLKK
jgi:Family of unknown function (DUF5706)